MVVACLEDAGSLKACLEALSLQAPLRACEVILADPWDRPLPPGALDAPGLRLRLLSRPGASPAAVSNEAVSMTSAELVAHLASDKKPCGNFLAEHAAALEGGADFSVGGCLAPKEGDGAFGHFLLLSGRREPRALQSQAPQPGQFCPANIAFKKEAFKAAGGFDAEQAGPFPYWADCAFGTRALDKGAVAVYRESAAAPDAALPGLDGWLRSEEAIGREKARLSGTFPELEPEYAAKYEAYSLYGSVESLEKAEQDLRTVIMKLEGLPARERAQLKAVRRNPQGIEYSFGALDAL